jgi:hypothetical protein
VQQQKHKHLYLVLDNWSKGYSIHRLADLDSSTDLDLEPTVLRLVNPEPTYPMKFAALGSNIFMASNQHRATFVYDTDTAGLASGPRLPESLQWPSDICGYRQLAALRTQLPPRGTVSLSAGTELGILFGGG